MPDGAKTGSGARWSEFDLEVVLYRRVLLVLEATRCREAADTHLAVRRVDPQEVLEERRLVPVEELGEEVMERSPSRDRTCGRTGCCRRRGSRRVAGSSGSPSRRRRAA